VSDRVGIEVQAKSEFWANAFVVEWKGQFPNRELIATGPGQFLAERDWLADLDRVARQCFCTTVIAPMNPDRRAWMRSFSPGKQPK
jgi:hypothetical protein